jgi:hypothetical protein
MAKTATDKARKEGRRAVKRAKKRSKKATKRAEKAGAQAQERAAEYAERAGTAASEVAEELAERLRKSEGLAKAQALGSEYAGKAKHRWDESELEDKLLEAAHRLRGSDVAQKAEQKSKDVTEASLAALGAWLTSSKQGKKVGAKLGVRKRSPWRTLLATAVGVAAGFAIARLVQPKPLPDFSDDFTSSAEHLAATPPSPSAGLVDSIRAALEADQRTQGLDRLTINVAEGTVFVRGTVPEGTDEDAIRDTVGSVPGVTDVDLQLITAASQQ